MLKILFYVISIVLALVLVFKFNQNPIISKSGDLQPWAKQKILHETEYFTANPFDQSEVEKLYNDLSPIPGNLLIRFQIVKNVLYSTNIDESNEKLVFAYKTMRKFFQKMLKNYPLNMNVDFILVVSDTLTIPEVYVLKAPLIVPAQNYTSTYSKFLLLAPDYKTIAEWPRLYNDILDANKEYPWEKKIDKAFWRSSISSMDGELTRSNWQNLPRAKLVELSTQNPTLIDARFTKLDPTDSDIEMIIAEHYPLALPTSYSDHVKYKIEINIDGNSASYPGFLWRLLSNSVVVKQQSNNVQWFYDILENNKHYISCAYDLSDIKDKILWLHDNDSGAKQIGDAGSYLIEKEITPAHLFLYWNGLLKQYASLHKTAIEKATLPPVKSIK